MKGKIAVVAATLALASMCACGASRPAAPFAKGERVTLLGDSITHGGKYGANLQLFWDLRFPGSGTRIMNCGISGGTADGGIKRWDRDVLAQKPDRIFVMFGMNDVGHGNYKTGLDPARAKSGRAAAEARYAANMAEIATRTLAAGKRLAIITPTPYDEYGTNYTAAVNTNCNTIGLTHLAATCRTLAAERGAELVDLHAPLTRFVREQRDFALCRVDRVHPTEAGHIIMTAEILSQMGVSPYVAQVEIDAAAARAVKTDGAAVSHLAVADGVSFDYAPACLPFPTPPEYRRAAAVYPVTEKMNLEILKVTGLPSGRYVLSADKDELGQFTAEELASGVNLALLPTPGAKLAMEAWNVSRELATLQARLRTIMHMEIIAANRGADLSSPESVQEKIAGFVESLRKRGASHATYYARCFEQYKKTKPQENEIRQQEDRCRERLRAVSAKKWHARLTLAPVSGGKAN